MPAGMAGTHRLNKNDVSRIGPVPAASRSCTRHGPEESTAMSRHDDDQTASRTAQTVKGTVRGVEGTLRFAAGTVGKVLTSPARLTAIVPALGSGRYKRKPGASPGVEQLAAEAKPPDPASIRISVMEYGADYLDESVPRLEDLETRLNAPLPEAADIRWVNIDGLSPHLVLRLKEIYGLHTLAAEDVLHVPQRPKAETYGRQLFIVARMIHMHEGRLHGEQVSFFLLPGGTLLSFQEEEGDAWEPVRQRIRAAIPRIRASGPDYLLYALLDAQIDHGFPLLERLGDELESLETQIMENAEQAQLGQLHRIKRELTLLRRIIWPTRDLTASLYRDEHGLIERETRTFLRDVYDHSMQLLDIIETYREMATSLSDLYMNAVNNRMNEIMKTLTIMASIFIPITFIAGVYGMNFEHMPELDEPWAYPAVWGVFLVVALGLLLYFWRRRWF